VILVNVACTVIATEGRSTDLFLTDAVKLRMY
jgi:hypothetical protein